MQGKIAMEMELLWPKDRLPCMTGHVDINQCSLHWEMPSGPIRCPHHRTLSLTASTPSQNAVRIAGHTANLDSESYNYQRSLRSSAVALNSFFLVTITIAAVFWSLRTGDAGGTKLSLTSRRVAAVPRDQRVPLPLVALSESVGGDELI
jgi:hypothetical protein